MRTNPLGALVGVLWLVVVLVPVYWVVVTSLRTCEGFFDANPLALPTSPTLENYRLVLDSGFSHYLLNSALVTVGATLLTLAVSFLAAYAIVRGTSRALHWAFSVFLLGLAIPLQATIIPVYCLIAKARMYDTLPAIVLPSAAFTIPLTVIIRDPGRGRPVHAADPRPLRPRPPPAHQRAHRRFRQVRGCPTDGERGGMVTSGTVLALT